MKKKQVKYFTGDIIYKNTIDNDTDAKMYWGINLIGVRDDITHDDDYATLFYRPFRNYFRNFWYKYFTN